MVRGGELKPANLIRKEGDEEKSSSRGKKKILNRPRFLRLTTGGDFGVEPDWLFVKGSFS